VGFCPWLYLRGIYNFREKIMSYVKVWLHGVWGTKNRHSFLHDKIHDDVCLHIKSNAAKNNIFIDSIDGGRDHLHSLMTLSANMTVSKQMQLIKGESSYWINKNRLIDGRFEWGDRYFVESVGEDDVDRVRAYIRRQKEHHKKTTFLEEYNAFLQKLGFSSDQG
jgi:REP element-mobilizing transposase RayT